MRLTQIKSVKKKYEELDSNRNCVRKKTREKYEFLIMYASSGSNTRCTRYPANQIRKLSTHFCWCSMFNSQQSTVSSVPFILYIHLPFTIHHPYEISTIFNIIFRYSGFVCCRQRKINRWNDNKNVVWIFPFHHLPRSLIFSNHFR